MLLVHDEYGHFEGLVTPADLLSAIAGEFASDQDIGSEPFVTERDDGSLLIAGSMPADQMAERLGIELDDDRDYATAAGHALAILQHLPPEGESFVDKGWRFEIRSEENTSELQSLMRISYAVFCLTNKKHTATPQF